MKNLIMYKPGEDSFIRWIKKRIKNNLNFICLFQGPTGIGKTWAGISMAYMIDETFESRQIVFDFKQLMNTINADWFKKKKWKIVLFDEPQITISNRNWQSMTNKLMNYLLTTFRHQNIILIFCSPYSDFLDSQSMKLLHCIFECEGIKSGTTLSRVRPKIQQYNSYLKKTYQHPLHVIKGKKVIPLRDWYVPKPPKNLIDEYEKAKTEFTSQLNHEIKMKLDNLTGEDNKQVMQSGGPYMQPTKALTEFQEKIVECWKQGIVKQIDIAKKLDMLPSQVCTNIQYMSRKGYNIGNSMNIQLKIDKNRGKLTSKEI